MSHRVLAHVVAAALLSVLTACAGSPRKEPFRISGEVLPAGEAFASALYQSTGAEMVGGNRWDFVDNGAVFDAIVEEVGNATRSVHVVSYIWRAGLPGDRIVDAIVKRRAGVACRILVDPFGSVGFDPAVTRPLAQSGCDVRFFRPLPEGDELARNHRKIVVIDGRVGITGGFGIMEPWMGAGRAENEWRDTNLRIRGPVVRQMQRAFAENWQETGAPLLPPGEFPDLAPEGTARAAFVASTASEITNAERLTKLLLAAARRRLWIANSYFVPDDGIVRTLVEKHAAGVDVRVLAPGDHNDVKPVTLLQRGKYDALLPGGVRVWEYQPAMMHAKTMIVDDAIALVGSINFDPLSLNELEECALVVEDPAIVRALEERWAADLRHSREIAAERASR